MGLLRCSMAITNDRIGRDAASGYRPEGDSCTDESRATDRLRTVFKSGRAAYS